MRFLGRDATESAVIYLLRGLKTFLFPKIDVKPLFFIIIFLENFLKSFVHPLTVAHVLPILMGTDLKASQIF